MYKILRAVLFLFDPEKVHYFSMDLLCFFCRLPFGKRLLTAMFRPRSQHLTTNFLGLSFHNPVGLGAGFDKNALYLNELEALGFGFVEIGTITPLGQAGNDKPRLFRLPKDKALINRMGFNNDGLEVVLKRLKAWQKKSANNYLNTKKTASNNGKMIIGGNIGKNKITPNEDAWKDYMTCFNALHDYVDYFVVNVSSPNTPGLRELQEKESLRKIISQLQIQNLAMQNRKPILLKIAPDLTTGQIDDIIDLAIEIKLDGLVVSNTTIDREQLQTEKSVVNDIGAGGVSGLPVKQKSAALIQYIHQKTNGSIPIIGSGGIFTGSDAKEKMASGASLVQVWTGFIYEGPGIVKSICKEISV
ncbi:MAG: quinone-dependent dihydroorotate dehydrogenase [Ferruginibacter sp.]